MSGQFWPSDEQFDTAHRHGTEYALRERANGSTEARTGPLSGEWAGDLVPRDVARNAGFEPNDSTEAAEAVDELADAWERGYFDAWAHSIEEQA